VGGSCNGKFHIDTRWLTGLKSW